MKIKSFFAYLAVSLAVVSSANALELDGDSNGAIDISYGGTNSTTGEPYTLNLTGDTAISTDQIIVNRFITNQGATGEIDITLPAVSYYITRTILVTEAQVIEVNPPSGEAFDFNGATLDANDCVDSPAVVGSKIIATRMQNASGTWIWSLDVVRGTWVDTGASD